MPIFCWKRQFDMNLPLAVYCKKTFLNIFPPFPLSRLCITRKFTLITFLNIPQKSLLHHKEKSNRQT